jgi:hypothetical protein
MLIDCDTCAVRGDACSECVIGVLLRRPPVGTPVDLDADEAAAFGSLAGAGMVPPLRLVPLLSDAGARDVGAACPAAAGAGGAGTEGPGDASMAHDTPDNSRQYGVRTPRRSAAERVEAQQIRRCAGIA